jgi:hypothetical protein
LNGGDSGSTVKSCPPGTRVGAPGVEET